MQDTDWEALKQLMDSPFGSMTLQCDQYRVTLVQEQDLKARRWHTAVYVDGYFKGIWTNAVDGQPEHDEARRFMRRVERSLTTKKQIEEVRKIFGKRKAAAYAARKHVYFLPYWSSYRALKAHLIRNNSRIERIEGDAESRAREDAGLRLDEPAGQAERV